MRTYTWDEYYEKFYDWAESTQVRNLSALTSLGSADEVGEIIIELQVNVPASNRLLRKAVEEKLAFSGSDLAEFAYINDKEPVTAAVLNSAERLTAEDMEYLYGEIDDEVIIEICKQRNILLPEALRKEEEWEDGEEPLEEVDTYTVRLTMVTDTVDGIMDMTMITAVNLAVIKAAAVWIKEMKNSHFYDRVGV